MAISLALCYNTEHMYVFMSVLILEKQVFLKILKQGVHSVKNATVIPD